MFYRIFHRRLFIFVVLFTEVGVVGVKLIHLAGSLLAQLEATQCNVLNFLVELLIVGQVIIDIIKRVESILALSLSHHSPCLSLGNVQSMVVEVDRAAFDG